MKKMLLAAAIACASLIGGTASAQQACMRVGGTAQKACQNFVVTGPGCTARSNSDHMYGYAVRAVCKDNQGNWKQSLSLPISSNDGNGGGTPKIQKQYCFEVGVDNGQLTCTKK